MDQTLSAEELRHHAEFLAFGHLRLKPLPRARGEMLLKRLKDNAEVLRRSYELIALGAEKRKLPAALWLLDNFYLIEDSISMALTHLPRRYSQELPRCQGLDAQAYPQIYHVIWELVRHSDGRVDEVMLRDFIGQYQSVNILTIGELWAIPIMLRLALIESLRRLASLIATSGIDRMNANYWAERLIVAMERGMSAVMHELSLMAESKPRLSTAFITEWMRKLMGHDQVHSLPIIWLEEQMKSRGESIDYHVTAEGQLEAREQVSMMNHVTCLRLLASVHWPDFVESLSKVDRILGEDPALAYAKLDFATRDSYRHAVERLAKRGRVTEVSVARATIKLCKNLAQVQQDVQAHVGYVLVGRGFSSLREALGIRPSLIEMLTIPVPARFPIYLTCVALLTVAFSYLLFRAFGSMGGFNGALIAASVITMSQVALTMVHAVSMLLIRPKRLPRFDFAEAIPDDAKTLVAIPSMLSSITHNDYLLSSLEVRYLANRDRNLSPDPSRY